MHNNQTTTLLQSSRNRCILHGVTPKLYSSSEGNATFEQQSNHDYASVLEESVHSTWRSVEIKSLTTMPPTPPLHGVLGHGTKRPPERSVEIRLLTLALFQLILWPPRASRRHGNVIFEQQSNHDFASLLEESVHSTWSETKASFKFLRTRYI